MCQYIGFTVMWLIHFFFPGCPKHGSWGDIDWESILMFVFSVVLIVCCVLMLIPCQNKAFFVIYLIGVIAHFVASWITYFVSDCYYLNDGPYHYNSSRRTIIYDLVLFLFNTITFIGFLLLNFQINISLK